MAEELSPDQVSANRVAAMGPKLGPMFGTLADDVVVLHLHWKEYVALFGSSPERVELLNKAAAHTFWIFQEALMDSIMLRLARLTDPAETGPRARSTGRRQENLTLEQLASAIPNASLRQEARDLAEAVNQACDALRQVRNKRLAHRDLGVALSTLDPLPPVPRKSLEAALLALRGFLNHVQQAFGLGQTAYEHSFGDMRDARSLLQHLRTGVRAQEQRMERFRSGKPLPEDLRPEPPL